MARARISIQNQFLIDHAKKKQITPCESEFKMANANLWHIQVLADKLMDSPHEPSFMTNDVPFGQLSLS